MKLVILLSLVPLLSTSQVEAFAPTLKVPSAQKESSLRMTNDISRRSWLDTMSTAFVVGASPLLLRGEKALAEDNQFKPFVDKACGFKISVPADWEMSEQTLPDRRRIVLFVDPATNNSPDKTLMFAAFTPVRDDYTSLSSFGSVDQVAQTTILPKGQLQGENTESQMISAESRNNAYFFDYKVQTKVQPETHYRTIFTMSQGATGGAGLVLVTLTAQTPESQYTTKKAVLDQIIDSFGKA